MAVKWELLKERSGLINHVIIHMQQLKVHSALF